MIENNGMGPASVTGGRRRDDTSGKMPFGDTFRMRRMAVQQTFQLAVEHHRAGRLQQAHELYRQLLAHDPNHVDALHLMGVLAHQTGRNDIAIDLIGKAIAANGNVAVMLYNLAEALRAAGQSEQAAAALRRTLELDPKHAA